MLVILLAFVFFLGINGKLSAYAGFVTSPAQGSPGANAAGVASSAAGLPNQFAEILKRANNPNIPTNKIWNP